MIRRVVFASEFFITAFPAMATGNEIDGFRLGMTMEQVMKVAAEKGYSLGKAIPGGSNWTSYILLQDGPSIAFCGNVLSAVDKTSDSNLHEFTHLLEQRTKLLGVPDGMTASQSYSQGKPLSSLNYRWMQENVQPSLSLFQWGTGNPGCLWLQLHQSSLPTVYSISFNRRRSVWRSRGTGSGRAFRGSCSLRHLRKDTAPHSALTGSASLVIARH